MFIGPMKKTLVDFWCLIWQEKPASVVMLTNLVEDSKAKCEQYWPQYLNEIEQFGPFSVTLLEDYAMPDYVIRNISVTVSLQA